MLNLSAFISPVLEPSPQGLISSFGNDRLRHFFIVLNTKQFLEARIDTTIETSSAPQNVIIVWQHYLELAAIAIGVPPGRMGSHSLRIGGATAMYHVSGDLQAVRRFGRWASDAFHGYLWESHEQTLGLASKMANDRSELTAPR